MAQRRPDQQHRAEAGAGRDKTGQLRFHRVQQRILQHQIIQRIGGQRQFREDHQIDRLFVRPLCFGEDGGRVEGDIRGAHLRRAGGHADEAVAVQIVERMLGRAGHRGGLSGLDGVGDRRLEPVFRLADAQFGQAPLGIGTGDLALAFPAIDGAAGPRRPLRAAVRAKVFRRQGRAAAFPPGTDFLPCAMHDRIVSQKDT